MRRPGMPGDRLRVTSRVREIRSDGRRFLNAPNHVAAARGWARLVERRDGYDVVEKLGEAGEITEHLDPRGGRNG